MATSVAATLTACAAPQTERLRQSPGPIASFAEATGTEFIPQGKDGDGSAAPALAMALRHSGVEVTREQLAESISARGRDSNLSLGLAAAARRHGRLAYPIRDVRSVIREINAGRPVVVLLNLGLPWIPRRHYAVVVGYDLGMGTIMLHSGHTPRKTMPMDVFERTWERAGYWAVLVLAPGTMPAAPIHRRDYLEAVEGLEYAGRYEAARKGYAAAVRRWPGDLSARMSLGNVLYALGKREEAAEMFDAAARDHPASAEAHNSLARVLMELGQLNRAREAAQTAVALNGPDILTYRQTLKTIIALEPEWNSMARTGNKKGI